MAGPTGGGGEPTKKNYKQGPAMEDTATGKEAIKEHMHKLYPDQTNSLQITALKKFWLGGPDPLDNILIFRHQGNANSTSYSSPHYHYITCGFSDLHGDGRTHQLTGPGEQSGFGFELTFRLKHSGVGQVPLWPATMLNSLARYVFKTGNMLNEGDHIPWQQPLDEGEGSIIRHMIITKERELGSLSTPYGDLDFRQVVGITNSEMLAAQIWKGNSIVDLMSQTPQTGGDLLVTDMDRGHSLQDYIPHIDETITENGMREGTSLGHITAACQWTASSQHESDDSDDDQVVHSRVEINMDADAAVILPHVIRGRLMKGRFFVYQNVSNQVIIFIPPEFSADMVIVSREEPLKSQGQVLQIFCDKNFTDVMLKQVACCERSYELKKQLPRTFRLQRPDILLQVLPVGHIPVVPT